MENFTNTELQSPSYFTVEIWEMLSGDMDYSVENEMADWFM